VPLTRRLSSAKVKNEWSYTCFSPICLRGVERHNFNFMNMDYSINGINRLGSLLATDCVRCKVGT
jgi:hypothetical protein